MDIEAVDEVNALILESVNAWKNYKKKMPLNSRDLRMSRGFNDLIRIVLFQKVIVKSHKFCIPS
jgi:hypothetical protein